ncbi:hypothetical protein N9901_01280 [Flavobacteriaceae bacterium]|nr:hypothetical protein [Flavobacteriaceae bacterium]
MRVTEINKKGNWSSSLWTLSMKEALKNSKNNTCVGEKLLLETTTFKVWSIYLAPGKTLAFHKHNKPYFYTIKNDGKSRSFYEDGSITETYYKKDAIKYFSNLNKENYFIHNLENIGNTTLIFTTTEFKIA